MINVCIIGTGNIGTDLLYKLLKLKNINIVAFIGRRDIVKNLPDSVVYTNESIDYFIKNPKCCHVVFNCTDANTAIKYSDIFIKQHITVIDLTPSNLGSMFIPFITQPSKYMNMVTCGGQSCIPLIYFISQNSPNIEYVETITQISSDSAGMATRINIDKYIETTENAIQKLTNVHDCKVILNVNPGKNTIMKTTVYIKTEKFEIDPIQFNKFVTQIKNYIPNYKVDIPKWMNDKLLMLHVSIMGSGDYISEYAGNLDIINCAAIHALSNIQAENN